MNIEDIIAFRKELNMSQERFAAYIGTTTTSVNRWENGKVKPSRSLLREIIRLKGEHDLRKPR